MKKLLSFTVILSLLLTFAFPVAQAGTITQAVKTAANKIDYITAGEFVTSLLIGAKVKPDKPLDYWGKALQMGLIPGEVKKDKSLTRAQASYIVWKLINSVPELRDKNIPVKTVVLSPVDYTFWTGGDPTHNFRGAYVAWGPGDNGGWGDPYTRFNSKYAVMAYDLVVIDKYYKDGTVKTVHVWNRLKDYFLPLDWWKVLQRFMKENPDKVKFDLPAERLKAQVWVLGHYEELASKDINDKKFLASPENRKLYKLFYNPKVEGNYLQSDCYSFFTYKFDKPPSISWDYQDGKPGYFQVYLNWLEFGKYKSTNINDWQWTAELNPVTNEALNKWLMKIPRKFPLDYTRFKYICKDFYSIPNIYQEPVLRLADLGIITPDATFDKNIIKNFVNINEIVYDKTKQLPKLSSPEIRFNAGKILTRAEATDIIAKVFDESKRVVFDEMIFRQGRVDNYGCNSYYNGTTDTGDILYHHVGDKIIYRIDELWQLLFIKYALTITKADFTKVTYEWLTGLDSKVKTKTFTPVGIGFSDGYGAIGPVFRGGLATPIMPLYDGTKNYPF